MDNTDRKSYLRKVKRVVIKIGSSVLTNEHGGINEGIFDLIAAEISKIKTSGLEVILVSSGAIAAGMKKLNIDKKPDDIVMKQALFARYRSIAFDSQRIKPSSSNTGIF